MPLLGHGSMSDYTVDIHDLIGIVRNTIQALLLLLHPPE